MLLRRDFAPRFVPEEPGDVDGTAEAFGLALLPIFFYCSLPNTERIFCQVKKMGTCRKMPKSIDAPGESLHGRDDEMERYQIFSNIKVITRYKVL